MVARRRPCFFLHGAISFLREASVVLKETVKKIEVMKMNFHISNQKCAMSSNAAENKYCGIASSRWRVCCETPRTIILSSAQKTGGHGCA